MEIKQINSFGFTKLTNAYHVAFFSTFLAIIQRHIVATLGLPSALVDEFAGKVSAEQDAVNKAMASTYSIEMAEQDTQRDNYFRAVWYKLKAAVLSGAPTIPVAVVNQIQTDFINVYPLSIVSDPVQVETAKIKGFIADIESQLEAYTETLGIDADLTKLKLANSSFEQSYISRVNERSQSDNTRALRSETEKSYVLVATNLQMIANTRSTEEAEIAKATECGIAIDELNQLIAEFKSKNSSTPMPSPEPMAESVIAPEIEPEAPTLG